MMKSDPITLCLKVSQAHASLNLKLDDELGTLHGLSLDDFILLRLLSQAQDGRMAVTELVRPLGVRQSEVVRRLLPLEKTGLVRREPDNTANARRCVVLRPAGRTLLQHALPTAEAVCEAALRDLPQGALPVVDAALSSLCRSAALAL